MLSVLIGFAIVAGMVILAVAPGSFGLRSGGMDVRGWERRRRALARVTDCPVDAGPSRQEAGPARQEEASTGTVRVIEEPVREGAGEGETAADAAGAGDGDLAEAGRDRGRLAA